MVEKKFESFSGKGTSLGGNNISNSVGLEINKNAKFEVDDSKPKTRINIRLHNGDSITQEFNLTHTLMDVRTFVDRAAPVNGTFDLIEGFPPKPITGDNKTIEELRIQNSTLTQRLS